MSKSEFAAPIAEGNDANTRAVWEMWTTACKANPVFQRAAESEDTAVTLALMLRPRLTAEEALQDAQRAYAAGELIMNRNRGKWAVVLRVFFYFVDTLFRQELPAAFDLVTAYSGDPPSLRLIPLFVTKKTVFLWTGASWLLYSVALFDNCLFVKRIGHFVLSDFFTWYSGTTHRNYHYIALERRNAGKEVLALVFSVREEFVTMLEFVKHVKPKI